MLIHDLHIFHTHVAHASDMSGSPNTMALTSSEYRAPVPGPTH